MEVLITDQKQKLAVSENCMKPIPLATPVSRGSSGARPAQEEPSLPLGSPSLQSILAVSQRWVQGSLAMQSAGIFLSFSESLCMILSQQGYRHCGVI